MIIIKCDIQGVKANQVCYSLIYGHSVVLGAYSLGYGHSVAVLAVLRPFSCDTHRVLDGLWPFSRDTRWATAIQV